VLHVQVTTRSPRSRACALLTPANVVAARTVTATVHHVRALHAQAAHVRATTRSLPSRACAAKAVRVAHVHHVTASAAHAQVARDRVAHVHHATVRAVHVQHVTASVAHAQQVRAVHAQPARVVHVQLVQVPAVHVQAQVPVQEPLQLHA